MREDPGNLSIKQLRRIYLEEGVSPSRRELDAMHQDSRSGVQQLYRLLQTRISASRRERRRITRLLKFERELRSQGFQRIAGVDEVGVGSMAGPVVAAAVVFPPDTRFEGLDDSKKVDDLMRRSLANTIHRKALAIGFGLSSVAEVDRLNVYHASILAMERAVVNLGCEPDCLLIDARKLPSVKITQYAIVNGDESHFSIAAASIVAKIYRDDLMIELDGKYPEYGFARHKGYCTAGHQEALRRLGCCEIHRKSYPFLKSIIAPRPGMLFPEASLRKTARRKK